MITRSLRHLLLLPITLVALPGLAQEASSSGQVLQDVPVRYDSDRPSQEFHRSRRDDVLVTESGPVVLSSSAPKSVEAIEALMAGSDLSSVGVGR